MAAKKPGFALVDGLRGVAALFVFALHAGKLIGSYTPASGYLAVDLFFILSGMVIAYSYDGRIAAGELTVPDFVAVRLIRFYPLLALGTIGAVLVTLVGARTGHVSQFSSSAELVRSTAATLFFVLSKIASSAALFPLNVPYWSLLDELIINLVFVVFWHRLSRTILVAVVAGAAIILLAVGLGNDGLSGGSNWPNFGVGLSRVTFSFFAGVLIVRNIPRRTTNSLPVASGAIAILAGVLMIDPGSFRSAYDLAVALIVFPTLGIVAMRYDVAGTSRRLCKMLGDASYGVYTLHGPATGVLLGLLGIAGIAAELHAPIFFVVGGVLLVAGVLIVDRVFDRPVRRWLTARTGRREPPAL